ncbi:hypothetical protein O3P69_006215 [Scylla paramamosain]|uniref:RNase H type-1 domain-containing protein n=1 Tax=Scylla paramamosain TaxID=85552 RepID=A0AAW0U9D8_SCYPA
MLHDFIYRLMGNLVKAFPPGEITDRALAGVLMSCNQLFKTLQSENQIDNSDSDKTKKWGAEHPVHCGEDVEVQAVKLFLSGKELHVYNVYRTRQAELDLIELLALVDTGVMHPQASLELFREAVAHARQVAQEEKEAKWLEWCEGFSQFTSLKDLWQEQNNMHHAKKHGSNTRKRSAPSRQRLIAGRMATGSPSLYGKDIAALQIMDLVGRSEDRRVKSYKGPLLWAAARASIYITPVPCKKTRCPCEMLLAKANDRQIQLTEHVGITSVLLHTNNDTHNDKDVIIYTDSMTALQALRHTSLRDNIRLITVVRLLLSYLKDEGKKVTLAWIPSHLNKDYDGEPCRHWGVFTEEPLIHYWTMKQRPCSGHCQRDMAMQSAMTDGHLQRDCVDLSYHSIPCLHLHGACEARNEWTNNNAPPRSDH